MKNIIIADDNKMLLEQMKKELQKYSEINILGVAEDGIEELKLIEELHPDIVITDIEMPYMTGIEVIEKVKLLNIKTNFIVITGAISNLEIIKQISKLNVKSIIYKPFEFERLSYEILKEENKATIELDNDNKSSSITTKIKIFFSKLKRNNHKLFP